MGSLQQEATDVAYRSIFARPPLHVGVSLLFQITVEYNYVVPEKKRDRSFGRTLAEPLADTKKYHVCAQSRHAAPDPSKH